jgi:hypothetical protein
MVLEWVFLAFPRSTPVTWHLQQEQKGNALIADFTVLLTYVN